MKQKKYIVIHDHQGGNFGMYRDYTPKEWKNQALEWCEQDDLEEMYEFIEKEYVGENLEKIIDEIQQTWDLEIVELNVTNNTVIEFLKQESNNACYDSQKEWAKKILKNLEVE